MTNQYNEEQIQVLEGLEAVRKRPGMYIGDTYENGLHHLVWEIVDNSIDESLAGRCDKIDAIIHKDNSVTVIDNGSGIPVGMHKTGRPTLEVVLTVLHAGGKFGGKNSGYKTSGGLHGVGSSVVNALSKIMVATVKRDGKIHRLELSQGKVTKEIEVVGTCDVNDTGTTITFKPDETIFGMYVDKFSYKRIFERLQQSAFLNEGLTISITDERQIDKETNQYISSVLHYERGISQFVEFLNEKKEIIQPEVLHFNGGRDGIEVDVAFQYHNGGDSDSLYSFVNNIKTPEHGTHVAGFKTAMTNTFKDYIKRHKLLKGSEMIDGNDTLVGLTAIVSAKVEEEKLQFEGQTKSKLGTKEARGIVQEAVSEKLQRFLEENPNEANIIVSKILQSYRIRMAAKRARELEKDKSDLIDSSKPPKFKDCDIKDVKDPRREVYFVEGDSAGGTVKTARSRLFQALLPLRGKIRNTEKDKVEDFLKNEEIKSIIKVIGTGIAEQFDYEKLKFNKIIIMTDADVDGQHISILLLTFFYRYMKPLVEKGHIYMAKPPLFKFEISKNDIKYLYSPEERDEHLAMLEEDNIRTGRNRKATIQRYKGLGEMNPDQLWETTLDPERRTLIQMQIDDQELVETYFTSFMGKDSAPRKEFLEKYGHLADLDA